MNQRSKSMGDPRERGITQNPNKFYDRSRLPKELPVSDFPNFNKALNDTLNLLWQREGEKLSVFTQMFWDTYIQQGRVRFMGNGGSAAVAIHHAADASKRPWLEERWIKHNKRRFKKIDAGSLNDNPSKLTMIGNDYGYDLVFSEQVNEMSPLGPKDLFIAISGSGNSPNVLKGIEEAKRMGAKTIGISGFNGGKLKDLVDLHIQVPSEPGHALLTTDNGATMAIFETVADAICHRNYEIIRRNLEMLADKFDEEDEAASK